MVHSEQHSEKPIPKEAFEQPKQAAPADAMQDRIKKAETKVQQAKEKTAVATGAPADHLAELTNLSEEEQSYVKEMQKMRALTEEHGDGARANTVDGLYVTEYWERMQQEIASIKTNWPNKALAQNEQTRLTFLQQGLANHTRGRQERREEMAAKDRRIREVLNRSSNEDLVFKIADSFELEQMYEDLRTPGHPLTDSTLRLGERVLQLETFHQWMSYVKARPWSDECVFQIDDEVTTSTTDNAVLMYGTELREALDSGALSKEALTQYMTKVKGWNSRFQASFLKVFEGRLPSFTSGPNGERIVVPPTIQKPTRQERVARVENRKEERRERARTKLQEAKKPVNMSGDRSYREGQPVRSPVLDTDYFSKDAKDAANWVLQSKEIPRGSATFFERMADMADAGKQIDIALGLPPINGKEYPTLEDRMRYAGVRRIMLSGAMTKQDAIDYLVEARGMDKKSATAAITKLESDMKLQFRDGVADDEKMKEVKLYLRYGLTAQKKEAYRALFAREESVIQTGLFTVKEQEAVATFLSESEEVTDPSELQFTGELFVIAMEADRWEILHRWVLQKDPASKEALHDAMRDNDITDDDLRIYAEKAQGMLQKEDQQRFCDSVILAADLD